MENYLGIFFGKIAKNMENVQKMPAKGAREARPFVVVVWILRVRTRTGRERSEVRPLDLSKLSWWALQTSCSDP